MNRRVKGLTIKEGLTNAARHTQARKVWISVRRYDTTREGTTLPFVLPHHPPLQHLLGQSVQQEVTV